MATLVFLVVCVLSLVLFYYGIGKNKKAILPFFAFQLLVGILAICGVFENQPLLLPLCILVSLGLSIYCLKNIQITALNSTILIAVHVLRIPVELVLYQLYLEKKIPKLMTFSGWNFDILMGISALLMLLFTLILKRKPSKNFLYIWNTMGILFLLFIVALAVLSSPLPIQQLAFDQPNIAVLAFPYCLLPTCVVPVVLMSHVLLIRKN